MAQGTDLKGKSVENTYQNLIAVDRPSFDGLDDVLRHLQDTRGTIMPIQVSKGEDGIVNITGTFKINGTPFTVSQQDIDVINELTADSYIEVDGGTFGGSIA